jgi:hypothetical protein
MAILNSGKLSQKQNATHRTHQLFFGLPYRTTRKTIFLSKNRIKKMKKRKNPTLAQVASITPLTCARVTLTTRKVTFSLKKSSKNDKNLTFGTIQRTPKTITYHPANDFQKVKNAAKYHFWNYATPTQHDYTPPKKRNAKNKISEKSCFCGVRKQLIGGVLAQTSQCVFHSVGSKNSLFCSVYPTYPSNPRYLLSSSEEMRFYREKAKYMTNLVMYFRSAQKLVCMRRIGRNREDPRKPGS